MFLGVENFSSQDGLEQLTSRASQLMGVIAVILEFFLCQSDQPLNFVTFVTPAGL